MKRSKMSICENNEKFIKHTASVTYVLKSYYKLSEEDMDKIKETMKEALKYIDEQYEISHVDVVCETVEIREVLGNPKKELVNAEKLNGDVSGLWGDAGNIEGSTTYLNGDVSELKGNVSGIGGYMYGLKGDVSGIKGNMTGIRGDVSNITGDVSWLRGDVSGIKGDMTGVSGKVEELVLQGKLKWTVNP